MQRRSRCTVRVHVIESCERGECSIWVRRMCNSRLICMPRLFVDRSQYPFRPGANGFKKNAFISFSFSTSFSSFSPSSPSPPSSSSLTRSLSIHPPLFSILANSTLSFATPPNDQQHFAYYEGPYQGLMRCHRAVNAVTRFHTPLNNAHT